jgi:RNA polymerase sigma factor (sigma-70 family)
MFNEKEIVHRILKSDLYAFEVLVKQYENLVFTILNRMLKNKEDVEDVCQEVFIKVHKNIKTFQFQSKLSTWIAQITYHTAINYVKKKEKEGFQAYPKDIDHFYFTSDNPEALTIKKNVTGYVNQLIEQLPLQYKTVITLYHINEFSYQEIEEITQLPEGTVKGYLFRARKLLKEKLEQYLKNEIR